MSQLLKRGIAVLLAGILLLEPVSMVQAAGVSENSISENIISERNIAEQGETISENSVADTQESISENSAPVQEETESEEGVSEQAEDETVLADALLNYIYVESPYLKTPGTQKVVAELGDESLKLDGAVLTYRNYRTNQSYEVIGTIPDSSNLAIFEIPFADQAESGIYQITDVTVYSGEESKTVALLETGIQAYFGVNEEVVYTDESKNARQAESYELETNIVTIDENGVEQAASSIDEAITKAQMADGAMGRAKASSNGQVVVVLDPGHDNTHAGARNAAGLKEEELTLKIAQYCKTELEQYSRVKVYMTRESSVCPNPGTTSVVCNSNRVAAAKSVGASVYVSIHLNTATASGANGAEVYYPNSNYNVNIGTEGRKLADAIQKKLVSLGLNDRGIKIMYSQDGTTYPDGSLADYYAVIKNSKLNGFPGIIIEHAFMTNPSDAASFLSSEAGLKKLGVADAEGIAAHFGLTKGGTDFTADDIVISAVDNIGGTFKAGLKNVTPADKVEKVQFYVYTKADKSDLKIYKAKDLGNGAYEATIYASKHKNAEGTYIIEAYVVDEDLNAVMVSDTTQSLIPKFKAKLSAKVTGNNNTSYQLSASGISNASSVRFLFYYTKDGKDKAVFYKAKKDKKGNWYYNVPLKKLVNEGKYKVYVYAKAAYGQEKSAGNKTFTYKRSMSLSVKATSKAQKKFRVTAGGLSYASKVEYEVYSKTGGKDDLKTYKAKKNKDGAWTYDIAVKNHKTDGKYYVTVYATVGGKKINVGKKTFTVKGPTDAKSTVSVNSTKATMTVTTKKLTSVSGIKSVKVKVWTKKDKSDAKWFTAKKSKADYKATVKMSKFNYYYGKYNMEVYATDNNNIYRKVSTVKKTVKKPAVTVKATPNKAKTKYKVTVPDVSFAKSMEVKVWSKTGKKQDLKTYKAKKDKNGVWYCSVKTASFKKTGKHYVKAYAKIGSKTYEVGSTSFNRISVDNQDESGYYTIMGEGSVTLNQMIKYYQSNASYPSFYANSDAPTLKKFCQMYLDECEAEGVKAEVAFAQAMKETNFLKYGGDVSIDQYNFAGIGATGGGAKGNAFASVRIGIRAQVQHLKAYASTDALVNEVADPRFTYVKRGICKYVEWLGINENPNHVGWATAVGYGTNLVERIKTLKSC